MTVSYTGKLELDPGQQEKLEAKYAKIAKLLDASNKGDRQAHIILNHTRGIHQAEITVNYMDHSLVGAGMDGEQYNALLIAVERLEKQVLKVREKRRDPKFGPKEVREKTEVEQTRGPSDYPPSSEAANGRPRVFQVAPADQKPMTVEEALLVIDDESYLVYVDPDTERLSVLLRRADGNFDLVQC
jgi:putative sigma-54 modulation protein